MGVYDISPPISPELQVWPGDTPPTREILCDMKRGDHLTLSTIHATVHLGSHADAPSHYGQDAPSIEQMDLDYYLGPCQVVRLPVERNTAISPAMLKAPVTAPRLLLATGTYPDPLVFTQDFAALTPELIDFVCPNTA
ncbi:MAG: hypothetical protein KatS3mg105_1845 [Gemmatales bacterium]|nr:MAG: hypothetical protein KatS3mg105_1845 [Gemmatales bacterium]